MASDTIHANLINDAADAVKVWMEADEASRLFWQGEARIAWRHAENNDIRSRSRAARWALQQTIKDRFENDVPQPFLGMIESVLAEINWHGIADLWLKRDNEIVGLGYVPKPLTNRVPSE